MRVVAGKHEEVGAAVADHPADVFAGERRELHGAADVFRRFQRHRLQVRVGATEALVAEVEFAQELRRPAGAGFDGAAA
jgi:hypothetical protein